MNNITLEELSQLLGTNQITIYLLTKRIAELEAQLATVKV